MDTRELFHRFAADRVTAALKDTPVVMVIGPRQCGKTTLVRDLVAGERAYVTLDDDTVLEGARQDPAGFSRANNGDQHVTGLAKTATPWLVSSLRC
jgi:ABC-type polar amino acid transport system ATPase subunit